MLMFSDYISVNSVTGKLKPSAKHSHPILVAGEPSLHPDPWRMPRCKTASPLTLVHAQWMPLSAFPQPNWWLMNTSATRNVGEGRYIQTEEHTAQSCRHGACTLMKTFQSGDGYGPERPASRLSSSRKLWLQKHSKKCSSAFKGIKNTARQLASFHRFNSVSYMK